MNAQPGRPLAVTMGDPAGIGGEIALKAWQARDDGVPSFFLIDSPRRLMAIGRQLGWPVPVETIADPAEARQAFASALPVLPIELPQDAEAGVPSLANAAAVVESLERGVELVEADIAAALVTNPIHKRVLLEAGFRHAGHTDYLAERAGVPGEAVMMLACASLRVVPITVHVPLARVAAILTTERIYRHGRMVAESLRRDFAVDRPRLAVAGLNPHAGEEGALGGEEDAIIRPAIEQLRADGIDVTGPVAADSLFHERARRDYDAALCMYHDQALIPIKTLDFEGAVNVTLGLPFVRTSPDHGTALDIAGTGTASPRSLIAALQCAAAMAASRERNAVAG